MKTSSTFRLLSALILAAVLFGAALPASAQSPTLTVRVSPAQVVVALNATTDIAIEVVGATAVYGIEVRLRFDPAVVAVVDLDPTLPGDQVTQGNFFDSGFVIVNRVDNTNGEAYFAMTQLNPSQAKNGTGNAVVIRLFGKVVAGASPLTLELVNVAQRDGTILETNSVDGTVEVRSAVQGPTNTPIPSLLPTFSMPTSTATPPGAGVQPTAVPTRRPSGPSATRAPSGPQPTQPAAVIPPTQAPAVVQSTAIPPQPPALQPGATEAPGAPLAGTPETLAAVTVAPALVAATSTPVDIPAIQTAAVQTAAAAMPTATPRRVAMGLASPTAIALATRPAGASNGVIPAVTGVLAGGAGMCVGGGVILLVVLAAWLALRSRPVKNKTESGG